MPDTIDGMARLFNALDPVDEDVAAGALAMAEQINNMAEDYQVELVRAGNAFLAKFVLSDAKYPEPPPMNEFEAAAWASAILTVERIRKGISRKDGKFESLDAGPLEEEPGSA